MASNYNRTLDSMRVDETLNPWHLLNPEQVRPPHCEGLHCSTLSFDSVTRVSETEWQIYMSYRLTRRVRRGTPLFGLSLLDLITLRKFLANYPNVVCLVRW